MGGGAVTHGSRMPFPPQPEAGLPRAATHLLIVRHGGGEGKPGGALDAGRSLSGA